MDACGGSDLTTFEYVEFAVGLPDHLVNISGLIITQGSQPRPFLTTVKANMYIEGFYESFGNAIGLDDHICKLLEFDWSAAKSADDVVVAALVCPITIPIEKDQYLGPHSSEEDDSQSEDLDF